jgi:hypothetical protein
MLLPGNIPPPLVKVDHRKTGTHFRGLLLILIQSEIVATNHLPEGATTAI